MKACVAGSSERSITPIEIQFTGHSVGGEEPIAPRTTLCPQPSPALGLAGLLIEFANPHLFLDAASLDQLPEAADRLLGRLPIA